MDCFYEFPAKFPLGLEGEGDFILCNQFIQCWYLTTSRLSEMSAHGLGVCDAMAETVLYRICPKRIDTCFLTPI